MGFPLGRGEGEVYVCVCEGGGGGGGEGEVPLQGGALQGGGRGRCVGFPLQGGGRRRRCHLGASSVGSQCGWPIGPSPLILPSPCFHVETRESDGAARVCGEAQVPHTES